MNVQNRQVIETVSRLNSGYLGLGYQGLGGVTTKGVSCSKIDSDDGYTIL